MEQAEYEVIGRKHGRIQIQISVPGQVEPIGHGVKIEKAKQHPDGVEAFINEQVRRIAARHADPGLSEDEVPSGGKVDFDPRTRDGRPQEELLEGMSEEERRAMKNDEK